MRKGIIAGVVVLVLAVIAYAVSPHYALHKMRSLAEAGKGDELATYVDFPAVRESVKTQLSAAMAQAAQKEAASNPYAALGQMLAASMVNNLVDQFITAESVARMVAKGDPKPATPPSPSRRAPDHESEPIITQGYEGLDIYKVSFAQEGQHEPRLVLVMRRDGLFGWKLFAVRMALSPKGP